MYYILLDPGTRAAGIVTDSHGFPECYAIYEDARAEAGNYLESKDCQDYEILGICTDERNHII